MVRRVCRDLGNNKNLIVINDEAHHYYRRKPDGSTVLVPGKLRLFSNVEDGRWIDRPYTILIDSEQLESGEAMSAEFKKIAATEIEEFKEEYRHRFPGRDVDNLTDEDLLREVMNTVGKTGKLGEQVRCVVSVSMLTEGWDANTVTHILGVRAFGTQLLCEQVVGRGLRRMSYVTENRVVQVNGTSTEIATFPVEYAEAYGVPFSFIPCAGSGDPKPGPQPTRVRALEERSDCEITFPRVMGYRYDLKDEKLKVEFTKDSRLILSTEHIPTKTENAPIVGESVIHTLDDLKRRREQEVEFLLAKLVLEKYFRCDPGEVTGSVREGLHPEAKPSPGNSIPAASARVGVQPLANGGEHRFDSEVQYWRFPEVLPIVRQWMEQCLTLKDNTFPQLLLLIEFAHDAADRNLWVPAINNHGGFGRWAFVEVEDPWNAQTQIRTELERCSTQVRE